MLGFGARNGTDTVAFSVLSLLPAVLFDLCLAGRKRWLVRAGYALSSVAICLHVAELFGQDARYHRWGLNLITVGFVALTGIAAGAIWRDANRRASAPRLVGTMSLFLLAISFVHFGGAHAQQVWSRELAFHHAAIPLALLVLLQDYRFVLLDAFLRFLANVLLAALFVSGAAAAWKLDLLRGTPAPFDQALLLTGACLLLIVFALLRTRVQALLTRLLFRRKDVEALLRGLKQVVREEQSYLASAAGQLGEFIGAEASLEASAEWIERELRRPMLVSEFSRLRAELEARGLEVVLPIRLPSRGTRYVLLGRRSGGRRYLSEDLAALGRAASVIVEQIEQYRESEMRRLAAQAELRALQSQIHPALPVQCFERAVRHHSARSQGRAGNGAESGRHLPLLPGNPQNLPAAGAGAEHRPRVSGNRAAAPGTETAHRIRRGAGRAAAVPIPVLSIQPLVENAVKHGIAPRPEGGLVRIEARRTASGALRNPRSRYRRGLRQYGGGRHRPGKCRAAAGAMLRPGGPTGHSVRRGRNGSLARDPGRYYAIGAAGGASTGRRASIGAPYANRGASFASTSSIIASGTLSILLPPRAPRSSARG